MRARLIQRIEDAQLHAAAPNAISNYREHTLAVVENFIASFLPQCRIEVAALLPLHVIKHGLQVLLSAAYYRT